MNLIFLFLFLILVGGFFWYLIRNRGKYLSEGVQWMSLLTKHPSYQNTEPTFSMDYHYATPDDPNLTRLRDTYSLDEVASHGSELDQIINLMSWVYGLAQHANRPTFPKERNAFTLIHKAQVEKQAINCYMKTVILNEVYLSMGYSSRYTHLLPYSDEENESHYVTSVYSRSLDKWIMMDPDFGVYVTDALGNILSVSEIRKRLISGEKMNTVHSKRSLMDRVKIVFDDIFEGTTYFWFLSAFLFRIRCPQVSKFSQESEPDKIYYELIPNGYRQDLVGASSYFKKGEVFYTNNEDLFWQPPKSEKTSNFYLLLKS